MVSCRPESLTRLRSITCVCLKNHSDIIIVIEFDHLLSSNKRSQSLAQMERRKAFLFLISPVSFHRRRGLTSRHRTDNVNGHASYIRPNIIDCVCLTSTENRFSDDLCRCDARPCRFRLTNHERRSWITNQFLLSPIPPSASAWSWRSCNFFLSLFWLIWQFTMTLFYAV